MSGWTLSGLSVVLVALWIAARPERALDRVPALPEKAGVRWPGTRTPGTAGTVRIRPLYAAVTFDVDGVVTDTASVHAQAWKQLFDDTLRGALASVQGPQEQSDSVVDYHRYVDGRSCEDGASAPSWPHGASTFPGGRRHR